MNTVEEPRRVLRLRSLRYRSALRAATVCAGVIAAGSPAYAQDAAAPSAAADSADSGQPGDIIVTAQKRAERLQDVPISITAVTPSALSESRVSNSVDLTQVVSGFVAPSTLSGSSALSPFIRGVGASQSLPGLESSVAVYVDGVYSASAFANVIDLTNIERIEVLKGPQGTLYGRNATGGAINIVTKDPSLIKPEGSVELSYGRFNETVEKGYLSAPLSSTLGASVSVVGRQGGNYGKNTFLNRPFGGVNSLTIAGKLLWQPTDQLTINVSAAHVSRRDRINADSIVGLPGRLPLVAQLFPGAGYSTDPQQTFGNVNPLITQRTTTASLRVRYSLPTVDLVSITGYAKNNVDVIVDADGTNIPFVNIDTRQKGRQLSQELQIVSTTSSKFQWIIGAFYINFREGHLPFITSGLAVPAAVGGQTIVRDPAKTEGESVFAQGTYELVKGTKVTAGLRYSTEKRYLNATQVGGNGLLLATTGGTLSKSFKKLTWRLSVDHQFSRNVLGYISYNRGFKSGGYNGLFVSPANKPVSPEVLDAYEAGLKTQLFDRRVTLNSAFYYYNYKNIQVQIVDLGTQVVLQNAASARLYGLDADLTIAPTSALRLNAGINLEHARYRDFPNASGFAVPPGAGFGTSIVIPNAKGQRVIGAPDLTFNVGGSYKIDLGKSGTLTPAAIYSRSSKYKFTLGDGNYIKPLGILNASLMWSDTDKRYSLGVYGENLTNVRTFGFYTTNLFYSTTIRRPRTYGVTASAKF